MKNDHGQQSMYGDEAGNRWWAKTLWDCAKNISAVDVPIEEFKRYLKLAVWYCDKPRKYPNMRDVIQQASLIAYADLRYPIICNYDEKGQLRILDGCHRLAKAMMKGKSTIKVKIIKELPPPDITK